MAILDYFEHLQYTIVPFYSLGQISLFAASLPSPWVYDTDTDTSPLSTIGSK